MKAHSYIAIFLTLIFCVTCKELRHEQVVRLVYEWDGITTLLPASLTRKGGNGHKGNLFYGNIRCFAVEMIDCGIA